MTVISAHSMLAARTMLEMVAGDDVVTITLTGDVVPSREGDVADALRVLSNRGKRLYGIDEVKVVDERPEPVMTVPSRRFGPSAEQYSAWRGN